MLKKFEIKILLSLFFILIFSVGILVLQNLFQNNNEIRVDSEMSKVLKVEEVEIQIETAKTSLERIEGLSGRENLRSRSGLLFIFENTGRHGFWMKDMNFPIDIIWFDENFVVIDIKKNVAPITYPEVFIPQKPAVYVLEVNAGFSEIHNINIGSKAEFSGILN